MTPFINRIIPVIENKRRCPIIYIDSVKKISETKKLP